MKIQLAAYKFLFIIIFTISSSLASQTLQTYNKGNLLWGAFNAEEQRIEGNLDIMGTISRIEKYVDKTRVYSYNITGSYTNGKKFNIKLYGVVNEPNVFIDDDKIQHMAVEDGDVINILSYKELPKKNLYLYIRIIDVE